MRVLLVYCHPVPESFAGAIRNATLRGLQRAGHEVELIDLYGEGFNPILSAEEHRAYLESGPEGHPVPEHARLIAWAEGLVFVYPTWWYGLPAMLKGWLDRVWTPGLAFDLPADGGPITSLVRHIRKIGVANTCGAPHWYSILIGQPGRKTLLRGVRALCARSCRTMWLAHYKMDESTPESRAAFLTKVEDRFSRF